MIIPQLIAADRGQDAILIHPVAKNSLDSFRSSLSTAQRSALAAQKFTASPNQIAIVPSGDSWFAVAGIADPAQLSAWCLAAAAEKLPQ